MYDFLLTKMQKGQHVIISAQSPEAITAYYGEAVGQHIEKYFTGGVNGNNS